MPKLTLFDAQTVGVDMKTNPLFVGAKRLHAATNLVFSEGVVKTRPGFSYNLTRAMGCFQGAAEFFPKKGLSVESFSEVEGGIAVVAGGKLYFNCAEVLGMVLPSTGDVNLYQAENYLIIQHADAATYWWDGVNAPLKSIGMNEQDWEDPSTDFVEVEVVPPVSNIPECENFDYTNIVVDFLVIDHITEEIIPLPGYTIKLKNNRVAYGTGTVGGRFNFKASKKTYTYTVEKEGYVSVVDKSLKVTESKSVVVRLRTELAPFNIHGFLTVPLGGYPLDAFFGPQIVPPGNAYRTKWRLHTDVCGYSIEYFIGNLNDNGQLLTTGVVMDEANAYFDATTKDFVSGYIYPEGMYLQLGVVIDNVLTWVDASPCIAGGSTEGGGGGFP